MKSSTVPVQVAVCPAALLIVRPSRLKLPPVGLIAIPPLAFKSLAPESVPAVRVTSPLTVTLPVPVSVPPVIESVLLIVEAAAIESVPPEMVRGSVEVRLLIESVTSFECTILAAILIVTSSLAPGTLSVLQLDAVSQLLSPAAPVQLTAESRVLGSIDSIRGRKDFDCLGLWYRCMGNARVRIAIASRA